ncbi:MAG: flagella basal body P-ring formation protein FlgA [Deltaproteobacteria bacterium HGW-Deltaproteobacteria-10]|nr:MAG: flagella basal body P-ring formation protein FlgA [Deltaproteobacteria bacterium HGW-Deltaproteobacteria-10]
MFKRITGKLIVFSIICGLIICLGAGNLSAAANTVIDQEKINKAIGAHIEKYMPWPKGSMRFEIMSSLPEIVLPSGNVSWKVDIRGNDNYLGDTYFVVKLYNKGVLFKEESIRARIEVLHEFVVSVKNLGRDSIISANDVFVQKKWVRSIPLNSVSGVDEVVGKLLLVSIRPNTELSRNMFKEVTAVKRGKMVQIVLDSGAINITTMGLSEEDGTEGSFVKVRNITSNKIIYARVVGESKVKVDFK